MSDDPNGVQEPTCGDTPVRAPCPSCEVVYLNGIRCHEHGCPDAWRDVRRECLFCGTAFPPVEQRQKFCCLCCENSYHNMPCTCDSCIDAERDVPSVPDFGD